MLLINVRRGAAAILVSSAALFLVSSLCVIAAAVAALDNVTRCETLRFVIDGERQRDKEYSNKYIVYFRSSVWQTTHRFRNGVSATDRTSHSELFQF